LADLPVWRIASSMGHTGAADVGGDTMSF
jgi:hypothetical protein